MKNKIILLFSIILAQSISASISTPSTPVAAVAPPTYIGSVQPGFVSDQYAIGVPLIIDFGVPLNGAQSWNIVLKRDGVVFSTSTYLESSSPYKYILNSADSGHIIWASVVAHNSVGISEPSYIPGVYIK